MAGSKYMIMRFAVAALLILALAQGCAKETPAKNHGPAPDAPFPNANVVIILVDALRSDTFTPEIMPRMTKFAAKRAVRFDAAVAQAPWTAPSVASVFTSLAPEIHGVKTPLTDGLDVSFAVLGDEFDTLAESFRKAGYHTAAFVPNEWLAPELGFSQGFDVYDTITFKARAAEVNRRALAWLEGINAVRDGATGDATLADQPFLLYLHYMDVHGPYDPPEGYAKKFESRYESEILTDEEYAQLGYLVMGPADDKRTRDLRYYRAAYDGGAEYADEQAAAFLDALQKYSPPENTILVFMADHGEAFFEHGYPDHGHTLHDEEIIVPLFIALPGETHRAIDRQMELMDIFPTLAELTGAPMPGYGVSGVSLAKVLTDKNASPADRETWSSCYIRGPRRAALRTQDFKLIKQFDPPGETKLFDLEQDPGETTNIFNLFETDEAEQESALERMNARAAEIAATGPKNAAPARRKQLDPDTVNRLKQLNYLE